MATEAQRLAGARKRAKKMAPDWHAKHRELVENAAFDTGTDTMVAEIGERLTILLCAASGGDVRSYQALAKLAPRAVAILDHASLLHAEEEQSLARRCRVWPVLLSYQRGERERTLRAFQKLPLAYGLPLNQQKRKGKRTWKLDTDSIVAVQTAFDHLSVQNPVKYDLTTPAITAAILEEWFEDIWFFYSQHENFHQNPVFRAMGISGAGKKEGGKKPNYTDGSPEWVKRVKGRIKERLKSAFYEIFGVQK